MVFRAVAVFACWLTLGLASAQAHFIWIDVAPAGDGQAQACLYFSEQPEPGEPHLIGKIAHTKAWTRDAKGNRAPLAAGKPGQESATLPLVGTIPPGTSLEASCDYGVYERGPAGLLLQYYAKRLNGDWTQQGEKLARAPGLTLDIVPHLERGKLLLQVLYQGKPSAASGVVVVDPDGQEEELKTDDAGRVTAAAAHAGRYAVRAAHIEPDRAGQRDGKKYAQTWHYCTLLVDVPPSEDKPSELTAAEALKRARSSRAVWEDFPGFTAAAVVTDGDEQVHGTVTIDSYGVVELDMPASKLTDWAEAQLNSLVQHRMPEGEVSEGEVAWAEESVAHPLGRKIDLHDDLGSSYRLRDNVIRQVNRMAGKQRFTISVLEIVRNAENKYLPRSFTMDFFNAASGELKTGIGYWNDWQRVGKFDVPKTILEISSKAGGTTNRQLELSNCRLAK